MEKKITVYIVKAGEVEKPFPTKSQAAAAVALLKDFGIEATTEQVKRLVTLA
ncbi:UNVERIFIED_CONTAM: hypothetical protein RF648_19540 [Kocuria sp. CPCC 205274]|uniref:Uncharacterized protein n=1 Tax=Herbiconiux daphne TaxID=2970914 RepID=A0ABT2HAA3_9MICO|nr:hypothetical protein [Herbiconiux daphne]MCS5736891.1 hypothetical protein [Herbiconiux daphne]